MMVSYDTEEKYCCWVGGESPLNSWKKSSISTLGKLDALISIIQECFSLENAFTIVLFFLKRIVLLWTRNIPNYAKLLSARYKWFNQIFQKSRFEIHLTRNVFWNYMTTCFLVKIEAFISYKTKTRNDNWKIFAQDTNGILRYHVSLLPIHLARHWCRTIVTPWDKCWLITFHNHMTSLHFWTLPPPLFENKWIHMIMYNPICFHIL